MRSESAELLSNPQDLSGEPGIPEDQDGSREVPERKKYSLRQTKLRTAQGSAEEPTTAQKGLEETPAHSQGEVMITPNLLSFF